MVRAHAPARRWIILGSVLLLAAVALSWPSRWDTAGRIRRHQVRPSSARRCRSRLSAQDQTIHELARAAGGDASAQISQVRERTELARTIGELQAGLARAQQDLDFYRAIANPAAASRRSVRVQQFRILTADAAAHTFTLRFALNRPTRRRKRPTAPWA